MSQLIGFADNEIVKGKARVQRRAQIVAPNRLRHIRQGAQVAAARSAARRYGFCSRISGFFSLGTHSGCNSISIRRTLASSAFQ